MTGEELYGELRASLIAEGVEVPRVWYFLSPVEKQAWNHACEQARIAFSPNRALNRELPSLNHLTKWSA